MTLIAGHLARFFIPFLWLLAVYACTFFGRSLSETLRHNGMLIPTLAVLFILSAGFVLSQVRRRFSTASLVLRCAAVIFALLISFPFLRAPEESVHFLQYGGFAFLLACALPGRAGLAFTLSLAAGTGDELIQYILPERFFDWGDIALNAWGAFLGLLTFHLTQARGKNRYPAYKTP